MDGEMPPAIPSEEPYKKDPYWPDPYGSFCFTSSFYLFFL